MNPRSRAKGVVIIFVDRISIVASFLLDTNLFDHFLRFVRNNNEPLRFIRNEDATFITPCPWDVRNPGTDLGRTITLSGEHSFSPLPLGTVRILVKKNSGVTHTSGARPLFPLSVNDITNLLSLSSYRLALDPSLSTSIIVQNRQTFPCDEFSTATHDNELIWPCVATEITVEERCHLLRAITINIHSHRITNKTRITVLLILILTSSKPRTCGNLTFVRNLHRLQISLRRIRLVRSLGRSGSRRWGGRRRHRGRRAHRRRGCRRRRQHRGGR